MAKRGPAASARRDEYRAIMRRAILDVARKAIETDGVANLSLRAVARDLGYSPAALYEYFPDRLAICRALFLEGAQAFFDYERAALDELPVTATAVDRLRALGHAYRRCALEHPDQFRLIFEARTAGFVPSESEMAVLNLSGDLLRQVLTDGVADGSFQQRPVDDMCTLAWSTVHGYVLLELGDLLACGRDAMSAEARNAERLAMFDAVLDLLGGAIRAP